MNAEVSRAEIACIMEEAGLDARWREQQEADWESVLDGVEQVPVIYLQNFVVYQEVYMCDASVSFVSLSMVLYNDQKPVGVWPFCILSDGIEWKCGSNDGPVAPPLFIDTLPEKSRKTILDKCLQTIERTCKRVGQPRWQGVESIREQGAGLWHRKNMENGATLAVSHELYVDLAWPMEEIRRNMRKSYKSLINAGQKLWTIEVIDAIENNVFNEFRELHCQVAGRVTRSLATWNLQEQAIKDKNAFLVILRNQAGIMVGGGLFYHSNSEGLYAVGAYDRSLFEFPLGHVVQIKAIEKMKELGLKWYKIGTRPYDGDGQVSTDKEMSIGRFKEGFATHIYFKVITNCDVNERERK